MSTHLPLTCVANITFHPMASFDSKQFSTFLKKLQGILPDSVRRYIQSATQLWDYRDIFQLLGQTETVPGESGGREMVSHCVCVCAHAYARTRDIQ